MLTDTIKARVVPAYVNFAIALGDITLDISWEANTVNGQPASAIERTFNSCIEQDVSNFKQEC